MANLANIRDNMGWLADRIALDRHTTYIIVGDSGIIHDIAFDLLPSKAKINRVHEEDGVEEGYFHIASRLKFSLSGLYWKS